MNYLVDVSYDGSGYFGWAKQPNKATIQGTIESALKAIYKNEIKIIGSGRTDAGVHALHQHFNFKENIANIPCEKLKAADVVIDRFVAREQEILQAPKSVLDSITRIFW